MEIKKPNINLFIVGAAKAGTTSLYHYLSQHSQVFFPLVKEPNYYSRAEAHNSQAYENPSEGKFYHNKIIRSEKVYYSLFKNSKKFKIVGDASPSYLWDPLSAKRIYKDFPNAKIIILLRSPTDRAYSHFLMDLKGGNQKEPDFQKALYNDKKNKSNTWGRAHLYEDLGLYYKQVKNYMSVFSRDQIKIVLYEDVFKNTKNTLSNILTFLNLDIKELDSIDFSTKHNPYLKPKNKLLNQILKFKNNLAPLKRIAPDYIKKLLTDKVLYEQGEKPKIPQESYLYLNEVFKEDIIKLEKLLNIDLSAWKD